MLTRLYVNNFRNLGNIDFRPTGLNLLIGPNNAGKTNLCAALRFLSLSSLSGLETAALGAIGETWSLRNFYATSPLIELEVECSLPFDGQEYTYSYRLVLETVAPHPYPVPPVKLRQETLTVTGGAFSQTALLENNRDGEARLLHETSYRKKNPRGSYAVAKSPEGTTMLSQLLESSDWPLATLFRKYLRSWMYFSLVPEAVRSPDVLPDQRFIRHDGANLVRTLFDLHNEQPRTEKRIIAMLRDLEPKVELFTYSSPDPEHVYLYFEDEKAVRFSMRALSAGTQRFLTLATVVSVLADCKQRLGYAPVVMLEEPENGLYVGHLRRLVDAIEPTGAGGQFIFSSHDPYFIDLFENNLDGVHLLKPGRPSSVLVKPDASKMRDVLEEMSLGELHFREMIA